MCLTIKVNTDYNRMAFISDFIGYQKKSNKFSIAKKRCKHCVTYFIELTIGYSNEIQNLFNSKEWSDITPTHLAFKLHFGVHYSVFYVLFYINLMKFRNKKG